MIHLLSPCDTGPTVSGRQLEDVPTLIRNAERLLGRTTEGQEELITSLDLMDFNSEEYEAIDQALTTGKSLETSIEEHLQPIAEESSHGCHQKSRDRSISTVELAAAT